MENPTNKTSKPNLFFTNSQIYLITGLVLLILFVKVTSCNRQEEFSDLKLSRENRNREMMDSLKSYQDSTDHYSKWVQSYRDSIQIIKCYTSNPNSAGGVDLNVIWKNNTQKTIKYCSFIVNPYNAVGDIVPCDIRGYNLGFKVTGPIKAGKVDGYGTYWDCAWYNHTIEKAKVSSVTLTFMDDTQVEFDI